MVIEYDDGVAAMAPAFSVPVVTHKSPAATTTTNTSPHRTGLDLHYPIQSAKLHSVTESAIAARKVGTAHRITVCAQRLADERGFDGFTMDDLAEAAGVSRRTLFNYYPGKVDAALGHAPDVDEDVVQVFRDRGPTGDLVEDIGFLIAHVLEVKGFDRAEAEVARRVVRASPRLHAAAHQRFEAVTAEFTSLLQEREGPGFTAERGRILLTTLIALHDLVLDQVLADLTGRLAMDEAYVAALRTLRDVLT
jgi:AcrR family transcriptional regulator